jgi:hypothetical protein
MTLYNTTGLPTYVRKTKYGYMGDAMARLLAELVRQGGRCKSRYQLAQLAPAGKRGRSVRLAYRSIDRLLAYRMVVLSADGEIAINERGYRALAEWHGGYLPSWVRPLR